MVDVAPLAIHVISDRWLIYASHLFGGAENTLTMTLSTTHPFPNWNDYDLLVDGMSVSAFVAAGSVVAGYVYAGKDGVSVNTGEFTVTAALGTADHAFTDLAIPIDMQGRNDMKLFALGGDFHLNDGVYWHAWGRFIEPVHKLEGIPAPMPVSLEGYKWPLTRR
jgi:hypothetical protein